MAIHGTLNFNKWIGKLLSTCFYSSFLHVCVRSQLFQCLEVLESHLKFGDDFVAGNMPLELKSCLYQLALVLLKVSFQEPNHDVK